jgi:hypothetical protein
MNLDSSSLWALHLFQNVVLFFKFFSYLRLYISYIGVFRIKISLKKSMCFAFKNFFFDSLTLKPLGLSVNLVGHFVAHSQPFNLVYR